MNEIIVITEKERDQIKGLKEALADAHNHAHFALDCVIAAKIQIEHGEINREELIDMLNKAAKDIRISRSVSGHLLNFAKKESA